jgi:hypothetical protein
MIFEGSLPVDRMDGEAFIQHINRIIAADGQIKDLICGLDCSPEEETTTVYYPPAVPETTETTAAPILTSTSTTAGTTETTETTGTVGTTETTGTTEAPTEQPTEEPEDNATTTAVAQYEITVEVTGHGTVMPGSTHVVPGTNMVFVFVPDAGYTVDAVRVNGVEAGVVANTYVLQNVRQDTVIEVEFKI